MLTLSLSSLLGERSAAVPKHKRSRAAFTMAPSIALFVAARKGNQQKQKSTPKACDPVVTLRLGRGGPNERATLIKVWYYKIAINSYKFCIRIYLNIDSCKIKIVRIACWSFRWSQWLIIPIARGGRGAHLIERCASSFDANGFIAASIAFKGLLSGILIISLDQDCFKQNKPLIS